MWPELLCFNHRNLNFIFNPKLPGYQIIRWFDFTYFLPHISVTEPLKRVFNAAQLIVHKICFNLHGKPSNYFETSEENLVSDVQNAFPEKRCHCQTPHNSKQLMGNSQFYILPSQKAEWPMQLYKKDFIERIEKYFASQQYLKPSF